MNDKLVKDVVGAIIILEDMFDDEVDINDSGGPNRAGQIVNLLNDLKEHNEIWREYKRQSGVT